MRILSAFTPGRWIALPDAKRAWRVLGFLVACPSLWYVHAQTAQNLAQVKNVYISDLGTGNQADRLRQSLIKQIRKSGTYQVVENPAQSDAVVKETGRIWITGYVGTSSRSAANNRVPVYAGYLSIELVGKGGATLWSYLVTPGKMVWTSITDDLTSTAVREMIAAKKQQRSAETVPSNNKLAQTTLSGAGATFPAPLYQKWFQSFQHANPEVSLSYDAVGSEQGAEMLADNKVDFAASDVSQPDLDNPNLHAKFVRIATVLGAIVPIYNLPSVQPYLNFAPEVLAKIYLGEIRKWNDPEIRKSNRGVDLPDVEIVVEHRSDGSGTTYAWSDFLSKVSPDWKAKVGTGTRLNWPVGMGNERNEGVASAVQKTPNSIGYVELVYAIQYQLNFGSVRNSSGEFIRAQLDSLAEAAKVAIAGDGEVSSITNPPAKGAYPIATFTWLLLPQEVSDSAKKLALVRLLKWILTEGQKECSALGYLPLPHDIANRELNSLKNF